MAKLQDSSPEEFEEEEQQTSSEGSESESESEPESTQPQLNNKSTPVLVSKKSEPQSSKVPADSASNDDESDSESNSESPIKKPNSTVKLLMDDTPRNPNSKNSKSNIFGTPSISGKRPSEMVSESKRLKKKSKKTEVEASEDKGADSKKKSKVEVEGSEDKRLKPFHRLWSEDDEIVILQGIIDYRGKKKVDTITDLNDFYEFIKKSINIDVSKAQLQDKVRKLKKKYENNFFKDTKGKDKVFWKVHEQKVYNLSEKVWGRNELSLCGVKREEVIKNTHNGCGCVEEECFNSWIAKEGWKLMKGEKREEMEEKKKKLRLKEISVHMENLRFKLEYAGIVFEALNSE